MQISLLEHVWNYNCWKIRFSQTRTPSVESANLGSSWYNEEAKQKRLVSSFARFVHCTLHTAMACMLIDTLHSHIAFMHQYNNSPWNSIFAINRWRLQNSHWYCVRCCQAHRRIHHAQTRVHTHAYIHPHRRRIASHNATLSVRFLSACFDRSLASNLRTISAFHCAAQQVQASHGSSCNGRRCRQRPLGIVKDLTAGL